MATTNMQFGQSAINVVLNEGQLPAKLTTNASGTVKLLNPDGTTFYPITSVLLSKTADQVVTKGNVSTKITFDAVTSGIGNYSGIWVIGAPSRFTVPSGFTKARITGQVRLDDAFVDQAYTNHVYKNGSLAYDGVALPGDSVPVAGSLVLPVASPWLEVVAGDYFELGIINTNATTDNWVLGTVRTWAQIELMP